MRYHTASATELCAVYHRSGRLVKAEGRHAQLHAHGMVEAGMGEVCRSGKGAAGWQRFNKAPPDTAGPDHQERNIAVKSSMTLVALVSITMAGTFVLAEDDVEVISKFEGNKGPGFKPAANVMGAVGPKHVVDFTISGFTVHDK